MSFRITGGIQKNPQSSLCRGARRSLDIPREANQGKSRDRPSNQISGARRLMISMGSSNTHDWEVTAARCEKIRILLNFHDTSDPPTAPGCDTSRDLSHRLHQDRQAAGLQRPFRPTTHRPPRTPALRPTGPRTWCGLPVGGPPLPPAASGKRREGPR